MGCAMKPDTCRGTNNTGIFSCHDDITKFGSPMCGRLDRRHDYKTVVTTGISGKICVVAVCLVRPSKPAILASSRKRMACDDAGYG